MCGVTTEVCVNTTVREANDRGFRCVVLADCCSWREVEVTAIDSTPPRSRIDTAVKHHGVRREFIGSPEEVKRILVDSATSLRRRP